MVERFEDFTSYIAMASKYIMKIKSQKMKTFGLKASHVMCLYNLGKSPDGLTSVELSTVCMEDKAAVSKTVAELRKKELISTSQCGAKIYRAKHILTQKGKDINDYITNIASQVVDKAGQGLSDEERKNFYNSLETITNNLRDLCDDLDSTDVITA